MKTGKTNLVELAQELQRQLESKKDFMVDTRRAGMVVDEDNHAKLELEQVGSFGINNHAHQQLANRLQIPKKYYDRMLTESPHLLATNVNHWFANNPEKRMIRTLDNKVRAVLSDRYRPLDNYELCEAALPAITDAGCKIMSAEVTESHLYLKAVTERITTEVAKGDIVQAGIVVSNSEIGCGSIRVEPLLYRLVCMNGMISNDYSMKKYHVGRRSGNGGNEFEGASEFFRTETRIADDRAFWLKVQDVIKGSLNQVTFNKIVDSMREKMGYEITVEPDAIVEVTADRFQLNDTEKKGVLKHLLTAGDLTAYGLANAMTRFSQDIHDYERATDFERFGGEVIDLTAKDWKVMNTDKSAA